MNIIKRQKVVKKPWGKEIWFAQVPDKYLGKIIEINPWESISLHKHIDKEETLYVLEGFVTVYRKQVARVNTYYQKGQQFHIKPGVEHRMSNRSRHKVILLEVSTCFPDDSIRLEDKYGRPCG